MEQSFNSLDAQREACEAYIMSQVGEGWSAVPTHYDDGGFSGGSMERPGLRKLLADIAMKKIDVVVVYKVDRLTRSLTDFARIVEIFDGHGVSFVSVTQAFNTTSSMGRLTLNVLLSFAQFEREVTGERIRDKIAASKKKGMWMGGTPPLGYRAHERTLLIDEAEAATVRHIFERYLALGSVNALKDELQRDGVRSRPGKRFNAEQGANFGRGPLYHLLSNRIYVGEIVHKDQSYPGLHPAIIDREMFDRVAAGLEHNRQTRTDQSIAAARAALTGLIFDADGRPLCPVSARNGRGRIYRYYVSSHLQQGGRREELAGVRLPAPEIEALVLERMQRLLPGTCDLARARSHLVRVEVTDEEVMITARPEGRPALKSLAEADRATVDADGTVRIIVPMTVRRWGGRSHVVEAARDHASVRARVDKSLIRGLGRAHALVATARTFPHRTVEELAVHQQASESYIRRLSRLAFLAPDIQQAIIDGRQPNGLTLERMMRIDLPIAWSEQRRVLGF